MTGENHQIPTKLDLMEHADDREYRDDERKHKQSHGCRVKFHDRLHCNIVAALRLELAMHLRCLRCSSPILDNGLQVFQRPAQLDQVCVRL